VFNARLGKGEVDTIRNFSVANDTIRIEDAVFRKVGGKGVLAADAFHVGSKAADAEDRIVYDARKGALYYDADGSGSGKAVQFAKVGTHLKLTHEDFLII